VQHVVKEALMMSRRTLKAGANTVKLHLLSFLRCFVCGEMLLSMNMGRPFSSGAYSTTEPEGKPDAAPSLAIVDRVPILHGMHFVEDNPGSLCS